MPFCIFDVLPRLKDSGAWVPSADAECGTGRPIVLLQRQWEAQRLTQPQGYDGKHSPDCECCRPYFKSLLVGGWHWAVCHRIQMGRGTPGEGWCEPQDVHQLGMEVRCPLGDDIDDDNGNTLLQVPRALDGEGSTVTRAVLVGRADKLDSRPQLRPAHLLHHPDFVGVKGDEINHGR